MRILEHVVQVLHSDINLVYYLIFSGINLNIRTDFSYNACFRIKMAIRPYSLRPLKLGCEVFGLDLSQEVFAIFLINFMHILYRYDVHFLRIVPW